jgi:BT1 family
VNWWILGGGLAFAAVSLTVGLTKMPAGQEIVFAVSMIIIVIMMVRLVRELTPDARNTLVGTALVIFVFRALPGPGPGATWWQIDQLNFDQQFLATLSLIASMLTLFGLFLFRRFMAEKSITYIVGFLTIVGTLLSLPIIGMYFGLHEWTARMTGGVVDARFIALVDTALESPLGQIAMVPMLAWIARSAPENLKATFFAVMASFTNLALSAAQLGTKYLNQLFTVTREVRDPATKAVKVAADYSQLGDLLITVTVIGLLLPLAAIVFVKLTRFRAA